MNIDPSLTTGSPRRLLRSLSSRTQSGFSITASNAALETKASSCASRFPACLSNSSES
ncbi:hypothetical protein [Novosphingobium sp. Gsoil 351]|uniref:hypothetical protein n=1 Tax=Novosphingobium sp. Gsoil 351 TaxID=2675225 RepID=UPI001E3B30AA|nr:hypothetical protein [Novosphingobium sp. Gsoil 351]